mmetsp:Transcript_37011/g.54333  ORF Transcript_37011/g.54333 Transcript_37011/m.54333 type:complete len:97 (+) Transcript_37011:120-410(+)
MPRSRSSGLRTTNISGKRKVHRSNTVEGWTTLLITIPVNRQQQEPASFNRRSPNPTWRLTHINHTSSTMEDQCFSTVLHPANPLPTWSPRMRTCNC